MWLNGQHRYMVTVHLAPERHLVDEATDRVFILQLRSDFVLLEENRDILETFEAKYGEDDVGWSSFSSGVEVPPAANDHEARGLHPRLLRRCCSHLRRRVGVLILLYVPLLTSLSVYLADELVR